MIFADLRQGQGGIWSDLPSDCDHSLKSCAEPLGKARNIQAYCEGQSIASKPHYVLTVVLLVQTFGRRLIEGLKADGQMAVGWVLQTFPKLLPFVMLSALRMDDDDYDGPE